jgi:hypothetical protein
MHEMSNKFIDQFMQSIYTESESRSDFMQILPLQLKFEIRSF